MFKNRVQRILLPFLAAYRSLFGSEIPEKVMERLIQGDRTRGHR